MGTLSKEMLLGASRAHDDDDLESDTLDAPPRRVPGKGAKDTASAVPYSQWFGPVDRRADPDATIDDEGGALSTAFSFMGSSSSGRPLPPALLARLSLQLGVDLSRVRIHDDEHAAKACAAVGARAFTTGDDIYFSAGAYDPASADGIELIAHEVAHIAQQARSPRSSSSRISQPGDAHERDADAFAQTFVKDDDRDPAAAVNRMRRDGQRVQVPFRTEIEEQLGIPLDFVEAYTGDAARIACELMSASAFAVRSIVAFADPSPQREVLMHELAHIVQMGGRNAAAPSQFKAGSLSIGDHDDAVEHDAWAATRGAPVTQASSGDVVRRADPNAKTQGWTFEEAKERFEAFSKSAKLEKRGDEDLYSFAKPGGSQETDYYVNTSKTPFRLSDYQEIVKTTKTGKGLSDADMEKDLTQINTREKGLGLVKVNEGGKRWAWVDPTETPGDTVEYLLEARYKHATTNEKYEIYCDAVGALKMLKTKPKVPLKSASNKAICTFSKVSKGVIITEGDLKKCRDALEKAIVDEEAYKVHDDQWENYFKDVVSAPKKFPQAMVGDWFGKIAARDMSDEGIGASEQQVIFKHKSLPNDVNHRGDGLIVEGAALKPKAILEFKTGPSSPGVADDSGEGGKFITQAGAYAKIIKNKVKGVKVKATERIGPFSQCVYVFPTKEMSQKWAPELKKAFDGQGQGKALVIYPPATDADGKPIATLKFNPTFQLELEKDKTDHSIKNPAIVHPGVNFKQVTAKTKGPNSSEIVSGEVLFDMDLQGGVSSKDTKSPITGDGATATVKNEKFSGLKSKFDQVFKGRVEVDAKLIEGGVEASLTVKEGPSGIPNLTLKQTTVKVSYVGGALKAEGEIELSNAKGNLHGKAKVSWDGSNFGFSGEATLEAGMVEGLGRTTGTVEYSQGQWKFGISEASYSKKFNAITLEGRAFGLQYDTKTGGFSGLVELDADLGMFGKASGTAEFKDNKLTKGSLSYDTPELKYPKDKPAITGTVGGTVTFNEGKFSGAIRGTANLNVPGLQKIAKDGVGLSVDAHIGEDGSYTGTISTTTQIKLGKYLEINGLSCKLEKDGSITGGFDIAIVGVKGVTAKAKGTIDKAGVHIEKAEATVAFGNPEGKFWGSVTVSYSSEKGFDVSGTANYKIKDDITATGTVTYKQETNAISVELKTTEITLMDKTIKKQLFKASKQFPIVNVYGLGIYVDIGFDLGFDFGFKITMAPSVKVEDFALDTMEFKRIAAKLEVGGDIYAQLTGTPKLGLGVFALDPSILRGGGGLKVPIVGRLDVKPKATFEVGYSPDGGADASAKLGIAGEFGIKGSVSPYAEFSVLNDVWNPKWEGQPLTSFEILKPQELFNFTVDLNSKEKQADPELPGQNAAKAPTEPQGDKTAKAAPAAGAGGTAETKGGSKDTPAKQGEAPSGGEDGPFSLSALMGKLESMPGFATAKKLFEYAKKIWAVVKPIWDIVSPLMDIIAKRIEEVIGLFDPGPSADGLGAWLWKLAKLLFNLSFGGITEIASAIRTLLGKAADFGKKLINKAVQDGHIGVKRHSYYIWRPWPMDNYEFMAAAEWKVNIPGVANLGEHEAPGFLLTPSGAVGLVLYEALGAAGVGYTYTGKSNINQPYNDRWRGAGARG